MVPITGRASSFLVFLEFSKTNREEVGGRTKTVDPIYPRVYHSPQTTSTPHNPNFYWRASEASETLFTHVYGISRERYIYIHVYVRLFLIPMRA